MATLFRKLFPKPKSIIAMIHVFDGGHQQQLEHALEDAERLQAGNEYFIRFEEDFRVTNGPDLFVYLGKDGEYDPNVRLAPLKGNVGSQNYPIPFSVAVNEYNEVWVWCRAFSVPFGKAVLR